jgi:hypothetical protein
MLNRSQMKKDVLEHGLSAALGGKNRRIRSIKNWVIKLQATALSNILNKTYGLIERAT